MISKRRKNLGTALLVVVLIGIPSTPEILAACWRVMNWGNAVTFSGTTMHIPWPWVARQYGSDQVAIARFGRFGSQGISVSLFKQRNGMSADAWQRNVTAYFSTQGYVVSEMPPGHVPNKSVVCLAAENPKSTEGTWFLRCLIQNRMLVYFQGPRTDQKKVDDILVQLFSNE